MGFRLGNGYKGSPSLQTSTANQQIIPVKPAGWTVGYNFYKFSFANDQSCTVIINNDDPIYLRAEQGFEMNEIDSPIYSFKIVEPGVTFNWIGTTS